jgi:hypothetical protein
MLVRVWFPGFVYSCLLAGCTWDRGLEIFLELEVLKEGVIVFGSEISGERRSVVATGIYISISHAIQAKEMCPNRGYPPLMTTA